MFPMGMAPINGSSPWIMAPVKQRRFLIGLAGADGAPATEGFQQLERALGVLE
jgi:hypothetical protein